MYTVNHLQLLLKGEISKFLEKLLFGTYHARVRFLDRVAKRRSFCYLLKSDFITEAFQAILKFLRTNKGNNCARVSSRHRYRWVDCAAQNVSKEHYQRRFFIIFQNFQNSSFSNVLSKMREEIFFRDVYLIKLIKWLNWL